MCQNLINQVACSLVYKEYDLYAYNINYIYFFTTKIYSNPMQNPDPITNSDKTELT